MPAPKGYSKFETMTSGQKRVLKEMEHPLRHRRQYDITRSPQYQQALEQLSELADYYRNIMQPGGEAYQAFSAPMMRQFNEQIMPGIAEQFAGVGGLSSSGFQQAATGAGAGLAERLAALQAGLQMQGAQGLEGLSLNQANLGMLPYEMRMRLAQLNQSRYATALGASPFGYVQKPESLAHGFARSFLGSAGQSLGQSIGMGGFSGGGQSPGTQRQMFGAMNSLGPSAAMAA